MSQITLNGKHGLVVGIANDKSIAYGCARIMREWGAKLAITYLNESAKPYVDPLAIQLEAEIYAPLDVQNHQQLEDLFQKIRQSWGKLDFIIHSIAFAPKDDLQGRVVDCSLSGFQKAMDVSCHSLIRIVKLAEPLMREGGSVITVSYMGGDEVVKNYNIMGPVKATLESMVRYLAVEMGENNIRVNALSPGAIMTRAGSGIKDFQTLLDSSQSKSSMHRLIDLDDIGYMAAFLASDAAKNITGGVHIIDAGYKIVD